MLYVAQNYRFHTNFCHLVRFSSRFQVDLVTGCQNAIIEATRKLPKILGKIPEADVRYAIVYDYGSMYTRMIAIHSFKHIFPSLPLSFNILIGISPSPRVHHLASSNYAMGFYVEPSLDGAQPGTFLCQRLRAEVRFLMALYCISMHEKI